MPDNSELTDAIAAWNALDAAIRDVERMARTLRQKLGAVVSHQATANDRIFQHRHNGIPPGPDADKIRSDNQEASELAMHDHDPVREAAAELLRIAKWALQIINSQGGSVNFKADAMDIIARAEGRT